MSSFELIALLSLLGVVWFWFNGLQAREITVAAGSRLCQKADVYFLDDSVAQIKIRLQRNNIGHIVFYREYRFEFTSDGAHRYRGKICLMGKQVVATDMEVYRDNRIHENE
ncbi:MAG: DUF3301 domain-containing protein [Gammaproteobacteria bacterium]|nr:DUF3301 domain-containing protein [Gammaproteobacteria bacterium]